MAESSRHRSRRPRPSPERVAATRRQHMLLLAALVVLVFASTLGGDFVWSDREDLLQGAHRIDSVSDVGAAVSQSRAGFRRLTLGGEADPARGTWQPLVVLSNTVSWAIWGDCSFCFHLENLLLHLALVIGVYALGRHLLSHRRHGNRIAAWAAALYAVHPAVISSVAWIGGRPTLLAAAFSVWALVIFTRLQATTASRPGHVKRWLISLALTALCAMLAHETAYMLPVVALLVAGFESAERHRHPVFGISPRRLKGLGVIFGVLLSILFYRQFVLGGLSFAGSHATDNVFNNLGMALRHLWSLIDAAVIPGEPTVSDAWTITSSWSAGEVAALLGVLVLLTAIAVGFWFRHPSALGVTWFLLWLIPGVGLFPSERYHDSQTLYLATWGITFAFAFAVLQLWRPVGRQLVRGSEGLAFAPIVIVLAVVTAFSNVRWWNHKGLFESEIASDPHYMEGRFELAKAAFESGDMATVRNHLLAAVEASKSGTHTGYWSPRDTYLLLGRAQLEQDRHREAANSFATALESSPDDPETIYWLGVTELLQGEFAGAEESFRLAMSLRNPYLLAEADLGVALAGQERFVDAYPLLAAAIDAGVAKARHHRALAMTHIDAKSLEQAARHLEVALALDETAVDRARLAWVYSQLGNPDRAREELEQIGLLDDDPDPYVDWVRTQLGAPSTAHP